MKNNNLPNIITSLRIVLSIAMLLTGPLSPAFFMLYLLCGASDVADGMIARRMGSTSSLGATLDSVADFIFSGVMLVVFIPLMDWSWWLLCWVASIAAVRLTSLGVGFLKYRAPAFLHTYANKATGLALFLFPLGVWLLGQQTTAVIICVIASISAAEELFITLTAKKLDKDARSIFIK